MTDQVLGEDVNQGSSGENQQGPSTGGRQIIPTGPPRMELVGPFSPEASFTVSSYEQDENGVDPHFLARLQEQQAK